MVINEWQRFGIKPVGASIARPFCFVQICFAGDQWSPLQDIKGFDALHPFNKGGFFIVAIFPVKVPLVKGGCRKATGGFVLSSFNESLRHYTSFRATSL